MLAYSWMTINASPCFPFSSRVSILPKRGKIRFLLHSFAPSYHKQVRNHTLQLVSKPESIPTMNKERQEGYRVRYPSCLSLFMYASKNRPYLHSTCAVTSKLELHNLPSFRTLWRLDTFHLRINRLYISQLCPSIRTRNLGSRYFPVWRSPFPTPVYL